MRATVNISERRRALCAADAHGAHARSRRPHALIQVLLLSVIVFSRSRLSDTWAQESPTGGLTVDQAMCTITAAELKAHLSFIASDELKGRETGSDGCRKAAEHIRDQFRSCGLRPFGDRLVANPGVGGAERTYYQQLTVTRTAQLDKEGNLLSLSADGKTRTFDPGTFFLPLSVSASAAVKDAELVFVGYGITDENTGYDDYTGIDARGKVAVMFRYEPGESSATLYQPTEHSWLTTKVQNAMDHGATGVIIVNGPHNQHAGPNDPLIGLWSVGRTENPKLPVIHAKQAFLEAVLEGTDARAAKLQDVLDQMRQPVSFTVRGKMVSIGVRLRVPTTTTDNVVGLLEGGDAKLKDEYIVVGAHYDHVGMGDYGSRLGPKGVGKVHNGADDDGSGTVAVLEVAQAMASLKERPRRGVLFVLFTGEEIGLVGSRHFVEHPPVPTSRMAAMINLDMIGRAARGGQLAISGAGTSSLFKKAITQQNALLQLAIRTSDSGRTPSDSLSFITRGIPVLFYFTGMHRDYHTPEDDVGRINFSDLTRIAKHVMLMTTALANHEGTIDYVDVKTARSAQLGILPDTDRLPAVAVKELVAGMSAHRAGVMPGDVIVELAGEKVTGLMNLHEVLARQRVGDRVSLKVRRRASDGQERIVALLLKFQ